MFCRMHSPAPGIVCRRARMNDYSAVLDINRDVYSGFDYMEARYTRYMNDPQRIIYVMEKDNRIVCHLRILILFICLHRNCHSLFELVKKGISLNGTEIQ